MREYNVSLEISIDAEMTVRGRDENESVIAAYNLIENINDGKLYLTDCEGNKMSLYVHHKEVEILHTEEEEKEKTLELLGGNSSVNA